MGVSEGRYGDSVPFDHSISALLRQNMHVMHRTTYRKTVTSSIISLQLTGMNYEYRLIVVCVCVAVHCPAVKAKKTTTPRHHDIRCDGAIRNNNGIMADNKNFLKSPNFLHYDIYYFNFVLLH